MEIARLAAHLPSRVARRTGVVLRAATLAVLAGCGTDNTAPKPNVAPTTELVSGPLEGSRVPHHVTFQWNGRDADGTVRDFDYILVTYPRSVATIDQVHAVTPAVNDPRWVRIAAYRLQLAVLADTLRADPRGDIGTGEFDRWHSFYLRAVDEEGAIDDTPESRTFQAFTLAPRMWLLEPVARGETTTLPRNVRLRWNGTDPIGSPGDFQDPLETRWTMQRVQLDGTGAPIGFPNALYDLPDSAWSSWQPWRVTSDSTRRADFFNLTPEGPVRGAYVFAVQGLDDGGAITPKFDATTPNANNYAVLLIDGALPVGPRLTVRTREAPATSWLFDGTNAHPVDAIVATDSVTPTWDVPVASHYGANANGTRYGWDITDVSDDNQWTAWSTARAATTFGLAPAGSRFYLQGRDDMGQITTAIINFIHPARSARR